MTPLEHLLVAALQPFSDAAGELDDGHRDSGDIWESSAAMCITAGDLRRAWMALAAIPAASGTEAGTGETERLDPKGDGPVPKGDAQ